MYWFPVIFCRFSLIWFLLSFVKFIICNKDEFQEFTAKFNRPVNLSALDIFWEVGCLILLYGWSIWHWITNDLPPLQHLLVKSCVVLVKWRRNGFGQLVPHSVFQKQCSKENEWNWKDYCALVKKLWLQLQLDIKKICDMIVNIFWMKIFTLFGLLVKLITLQIDKRFSVTSNLPIDYSGVITSKRVTNLQAHFWRHSAQAEYIYFWRNVAVVASRWQLCARFDRPEIWTLDHPLDTKALPFDQLADIFYQNVSKNYNILL